MRNNHGRKERALFQFCLPTTEPEFPIYLGCPRGSSRSCCGPKRGGYRFGPLSFRWTRDDRLRILTQRFSADSGAIWSGGKALRLARHMGKRQITQAKDYLEQLRKRYLPKIELLFEGRWPEN